MPPLSKRWMDEAWVLNAAGTLYIRAYGIVGTPFEGAVPRVNADLDLEFTASPPAETTYVLAGGDFVTAGGDYVTA
jgi:hypothetical protein